MMAGTTVSLVRSLSIATRFALQNSKLNKFTCCTAKVLSASRYNYDFTRCLSASPKELIKFRQLVPKQNLYHDQKLLQIPKYPIDIHCNNFSMFKRRNNPGKKKKRIPKLILLQNPFNWLMTKIDFTVLRRVWDPTFREKEFRFGTTQAISRVTHIISEGQLEELNGLLTKPARVSLLRELERNWGEKQRALLALKHEDIQISSPRKVYFIRIADKKFCDVDMAFLALKWAPINNIEALIFTEIFARFHREYTPNCIPEWTIAYFKVTRFEVLRK
ncbi:m-AAA protease-interacting protein 1, mitochondrial [Colias croceus]|uniref:m-AAA protease-interacting protein 1, mitochondrial n=1 Tax=Colias crocea TaxID=72248 RepID=UPI001E27E47D|nr:m-AAA protease-interacting protein 1, mitochondrial [Colias croceus]